MTAASRILNQTRLQSMAVAGLTMRTRFGLVTSYDPDTYAVKVRLQPDDVETGWLPIVAGMAGNGWGVQAAPEIDDQAVLTFAEGDSENGACIGFLFSDVDRPARLESGEVRFRNRGGATIHLTNAGAVRIEGETRIEGGLQVDGAVTVGVGASGSFTTPTGQVVIVQDGIVTSIF